MATSATGVVDPSATSATGIINIDLAVQGDTLFHRRGYHLNLIYLFSPGLVTLLASAGRKKIGATSATVTS